MSFPMINAAVAAEHIADLHREAAKRRLVLAALRARRRKPARHAAGGNPPPAAPIPQQRRTNTGLYDTPPSALQEGTRPR